jgi:hypothetical protein
MPEPTIKRRLTEAGAPRTGRRRPDLLDRGQAGRRPIARDPSIALSRTEGRSLRLRRDLLCGTNDEEGG